jgi:hypothetical protein
LRERWWRAFAMRNSTGRPKVSLAASDVGGTDSDLPSIPPPAGRRTNEMIDARLLPSDVRIKPLGHSQVSGALIFRERLGFGRNRRNRAQKTQIFCAVTIHVGLGVRPYSSSTIGSAQMPMDIVSGPKDLPSPPILRPFDGRHNACLTPVGINNCPSVLRRSVMRKCL